MKKGRYVSRNLALFGVFGFLGLVVLAGGAVLAADHGDTPLLKEIGRHDARFAGVFAFLRGDNLVLIATVDPTIPAGTTEYFFPPDLAININVDNDSEVSADDADDLAEFGGTIVNPRRIKEDIVFKVRFGEGLPTLQITGLPRSAKEDVVMFAGLRDDPFIRRPRIGKNIAAIVLEMPLSSILNDQDTVLVWGTSKVEDVRGRFQDLAGRALRSQFPENDLLNTTHPRDHTRLLGVPPDVVIYNTSLAAAFPNGRELTDDVVDLVGRALPGEDPSPDENDVDFLEVFPYLAPPQ